MAKFQVITKVSDGEGNLASTVNDLWFQSSDGSVEKVDFELSMHYMTSVFNVGEILIVNESGREIPFPGRKASKWDVVYEEYDDLEVALERSEKVFNESLKAGRENG